MIKDFTVNEIVDCTLAIVEAQITNLPVVVSDSVPHETKLCDCVEFMPLAKTPHEWAETALRLMEKTKRQDNTELLQKAGFDIKIQYKWLENFYIKIFISSHIQIINSF